MPSIGARIGKGEIGLGDFTTFVVIDSQELAKELRGPDGIVLRDLIKKGNAVKDRAKQLVGVDTGRLRDSIVTRITPTTDTYMVVVGSEVEYAYWHHEGNTRGWRGNPFLENAVRELLL